MEHHESEDLYWRVPRTKLFRLSNYFARVAANQEASMGDKMLGALN
jgi:hypothetical protein